MVIFELLFSQGEGAQWNNFHKPGAVDDNISLLECMLMLLCDSLIHCIITWYLDNVRPGEFGVPKPFYFPFTVSFMVLKPMLFIMLSEMTILKICFEKFKLKEIGLKLYLVPRDVQSSFSSFFFFFFWFRNVVVQWNKALKGINYVCTFKST